MAARKFCFLPFSFAKHSCISREKIVGVAKGGYAAAETVCERRALSSNLAALVAAQQVADNALAVNYQQPSYNKAKGNEKWQKENWRLYIKNASRPAKPCSWQIVWLAKLRMSRM
ncbi:hypothetical protein [Parasediminibacterium sp. JCM 36343]|uniref:hypothetical protein n=1 Tax=Parasediminibacterium sp. JCM 36343 TaxID=3374279 RepID=UPI00397C6874